MTLYMVEDTEDGRTGEAEADTAEDAIALAVEAMGEGKWRAVALS